MLPGNVAKRLLSPSATESNRRRDIPMNRSKTSTFFPTPRLLGHPARRRSCRRINLILTMSMALWPGMASLHAETGSDSPVFGVFTGSSPFGEPIKSLLRIPPAASGDLMQWKLTLYGDGKTQALAAYKLHCEYGPAVPGLPGLGRSRTAIDREGSWTMGKGIQSN